MKAACTECSIGQQGFQGADDLFGPGIGRREETDANQVRFELKNPWRNVGEKNVVVDQLYLEAAFFKKRSYSQNSERRDEVVCFAYLYVYECDFQWKLPDYSLANVCFFSVVVRLSAKA